MMPMGDLVITVRVKGLRRFRAQMWLLCVAVRFLPRRWWRASFERAVMLVALWCARRLSVEVVH